MTPHIKRICFTILAVLSFPLFLVTLLAAISLINPMGMAFLTSFSIHNNSGIDIRVTPIGAVGKQGSRSMLPLSVSRFVYLMSLKTSEFSISTGETRSFTYDWDDIQFCDILIRSPEGDYRVLTTGLHPTENQYRRPQKREFVIPPLYTLSQATDVHLHALHSKPRRIFSLYVLGVLGLTFPFFTYTAIKAKKKREPAG